MRDDVSPMEARMMAEKAAERAAYNKSMIAGHPVDQCATTDSSCGSRQSARAVLEQRYDALLREADGLRALLQALPGSMGHVAEEALWRIVIEQRR